MKMENENKDIKSDAKDCAKLISDSKKDTRIYSYISVAMKSYIDGINAAINCKHHAQLLT